jgi:hypothetical protein
MADCVAVGKQVAADSSPGQEVAQLCAAHPPCSTPYKALVTHAAETVATCIILMLRGVPCAVFP